MIVEHSQGNYEILVEAGALGQIDKILSSVVPNHRAVIVVDAAVNRLHPEVCSGMKKVVLSSGEANKTRDSWTTITNQLLRLGYDRKTVVLAIGGGVTTDLAGFVAATYMRGVPWIAIPTTTLAMCDAAVGGKTGVDTDQGKNLVGAFHQPSAVVSDLNLLASLPQENFIDGLAEVVKHAAIMDRQLFGRLEQDVEHILERDPRTLVHLVRTSCQIKAAVVGQDEYEMGKRAILNAGHTLGHALEHASRFALSHGQAVSIGLVEEARIGEQQGITKAGTARQLARLLERLGLPTRIPDGVEQSIVAAAMTMDKKNFDDKVRAVLLREIGSVARPVEDGWTWPIN